MAPMRRFLIPLLLMAGTLVISPERAAAGTDVDLVLVIAVDVSPSMEIDEQELRGMASAMFGSDLTRQWWQRVGDQWIGTRNRPDRVRFLEVVSEECAAAASVDGAGWGQPAPQRAWGLLAIGVAGLACGAVLARRRQAARIRPLRTSSMNQRQGSD